VRAVRRPVGWGAVAVVAVILSLPAGSGGATPSGSFALQAPYHGHAFSSVQFTHGCQQNQFLVAPRFHKSSGIASDDQRSQVPGAACAGANRTAQSTAFIGFLTRNFTVHGGSQVLVTWRMNWTANLTEAGGYRNATASYSIGFWETLLCALSPSAGSTWQCTSFANGGNGGGAATGGPSWQASAFVPHLRYPGNRTWSRTYSSLENVVLNTTLNSAYTYNILLEIQVWTLASATPGHYARSEVTLDGQLQSIRVA